MPGSWLYASSRTGYIDSEIYEEWFQKIFLPNNNNNNNNFILSPKNPINSSVDFTN